MIPSTSLVAVAAAVGLVTQLVLSSINEVDTLKFIGSAFVSEVLVLAILLKNVYTASVGLSVAAVTFLQLNASFFTTLIVATVIRRLFFHPLRKFPGRKLAAVSKIYECFLNSQGTNALKVREWHNELGDFVRTAPNEISINNVEALQLYQRQTYDSRGPLYEFAKVVGDYNLLTARQNATHRKWRAIWLVLSLPPFWIIFAYCVGIGTRDSRPARLRPTTPVWNTMLALLSKFWTRRLGSRSIVSLCSPILHSMCERCNTPT